MFLNMQCHAHWLPANDVAGQETGRGRWAAIPGSDAKAPKGSSCLRLWLEVAQQSRVPVERENADALTCH